jgi:predicted PurR-regulated permease PerM
MRRITKLTPKSIATLVLLGIASYFLVRMLLPFSAPIFWSITLAIFVFPLQEQLNRKFRSKNTAALIGTLITATVILVPVVILSIQLGHEVNALYQRLRDWEGMDRIFYWFNGGAFSIWLEQNLGISVDSLRQTLSGNLKGMANSAMSFATGLISNTVSLIINIIFILFTLFFLLRDGNLFLHWLMELMPMHEERKQELVKRVRDVINATVVGNLAVAGTQGTLAGLMFYILGIPGSLLWTLVMVVLSMIPLLGSFIVWMPAAIWLLASGHITKGIVLIAWGSIVVGLVDNFMRPMMVGKQTRLHTIVVFYAVLGGIKIFGPLGLVFGPVIFACFITLLKFIAPHHEEEQVTIKDGEINKAAD